MMFLTGLAAVVVALLLFYVDGFSSLPTSTLEDILKFYRELDFRPGTYNLLRGNPEVNMNTAQLIRSKGYPVEFHNVVTEDGYILGVYRIPYGRNNKDSYKNGTRPVVLLQHGLFGDCDNFLLNPANESLAFILADAGADVWMGNTRGSAASRRHTTLDPKKIQFWKYSWDEMAQYDLPATIYHILNQTHHDQIYYVGHSQGTAIGFARFGEDQALASRIKHFMALAPIGRIAYAQTPIRYMLPFTSEIEFFMDTFGHGELNVPQPILKFFAAGLCEKWGEPLCESLIFLFCGFNEQSFNKSRIDVYVSHGMEGDSAQNLLHWAQTMRDKQFQRFDYGEKGNLAKYGQKTPPIYDPSKVKVPVAIFRGGQDLFADETDVDWLLKQLNVTHDTYIPFYEHLDPVIGFDAATLMYRDIVDIVMG
ncbi:hypothetical protein EGW08_009793 [Elysia chlorotica]|uniref:Lipase n=1 Tax=Elysia chlorotica TaxID=188477 RepID=A0A433TLG7_ELYCH|nr:hypothetical protein EGW08_009793 [Elysia chlorotica]